MTDRKPLIQRMSDYVADIPENVDWVVDRLVYAGGITLVAGAPKAGKSTLVADMIRALKAGELWAGSLATRDAPVLLLTEEQGVAVRHKYGDLDMDVMDSGSAAQADAEGRTGKTYRESAAGGRHKGVREVDERRPVGFAAALLEAKFWATTSPRSLVVVDTLAVWSRVQDENDSAEMTRAIREVKDAFHGLDAAVILVHHTRKGGGYNGEAIRGSGAIQATVDLTAELGYKTNNRDDRRTLSIGGRVVFPETIMLGFERETKRYTRLADEVADDASPLMAEMTFEGGGGGMSVDDARRILGKDPRNELKRLEGDHQIVGVMVKVGRTKALRYWRPLTLPDENAEQDA